MLKCQELHNRKKKNIVAFILLNTAYIAVGRMSFLGRVNHGVYQSCFLLTTLLIAYGFFFILLKVNSRVSQGKKHNKSLHTCK